MLAKSLHEKSTTDDACRVAALERNSDKSVGYSSLLIIARLQYRVWHSRSPDRVYSVRHIAELSAIRYMCIRKQ